MASALVLKVGPLTATRTFADDAKVQAVLLRFAGPPDALTNQEKLDYVLARLEELVLQQARLSRAHEIVTGAADVAAQEVRFE